MATINDITSTDNGADSLIAIEANFTNLNTDKLDVDGSVEMAANIPMGGYKITGLGTPTADTDASTKAYVDSNSGSDTVFNVTSYGATGDGTTDDTEAIQDALDAANTAGGGTVFVPIGSYLVTDTLTVYSNTIFYGEGYGSVIKGAVDNVAKSIIFVNTSSIGCVIKGLHVDGQGSPHYTHHGILVAGTYHVVKDCFVRNIWADTSVVSDGIRVDHDSSQITIDNNFVKNINRLGISVAYSCHYIEITNNYCEATGTSGEGAGINLHEWDISHVLVDHNICYNVAGDFLTSYNSGNSFLTFTNNIGYKAGNHGCHIGGDNVKVSNNHFYDINPSSLKYGIYVYNHDGTNINDAQITNNVLSGDSADIGIYLRAVTYGQVTDNKIDYFGSHGIKLNTCILFQVNDNMVRNCGGDGITVEDSFRGTINSNITYNITANGIHFQDSGTECVEITVNANLIRNCGGRGIYSEDDSNFLCITGNVLYGNTGSNISIVGANNVNANNIS